MRKKINLILSFLLLLTVVSSTVVFAMSAKPVEETEYIEPVANEDGLVAYYTFDKNLKDATSNFGEGEVVGKLVTSNDSGSITYSKGMRNQAAVFDGKSGVRLPKGLITDNSYSVSMWLNPRAITDFTTTFFGGINEEETGRQKWISLQPKGPVGRTMLWSGNDPWYDADTPLTIPKKQWTHVAFTVDNGKVKVYLNGKELFAGRDFPDIFTDEDSVFALAVNYWDTPFKGMIDELRIYDVVIDENRIAELAKGAAELEAPDMIKVPLDPNGVSVHDPSVIKADGTYWVFGSHLASAYSKDLINWKQYSDHVHNGNPLIPNVTEEMSEGLEWAQTDTFWAPDVIQLEDGKYYMYYNMCKGDSPRSALGLAVSDKIEGPYQDKGIFLKSGMWGEAGADGEIYDATIHPNTVDPDVFYDKEGKLRMVYGSYSGGIFILELDPTTGKPYADQGYGKKLLGGNHSRIEAPYILYSPEADYYYLFLSYGGLGADGGYNIRIARSKNPDGPYYDAKGQDMIDSHGSRGTFFDDAAISPYGVKLMGNFVFHHQLGELAKHELGYVSPGHNSAYYDQESGKHYILFHTRFPGQGEGHQLRVHQMFINSEGWLVVAPHRYREETIGEYTVEDVIGQYELVNHGKDITADIKESVIIKLNEDGTISGEVDGYWELSEGYNVKLTVDGSTYNGVFLEQWDDGLEEDVMTFSALSQGGVSIWGSHLDE
ncbi:arabinan endo-1,5-alpha-L-arabinosidase [Orenia metallireducens]|uniref:Arabinan endo-1,5-alpha-L-arabinosidase n=2 Tax=Orenia metallireducens TaxID=1413210 RepID=A0A285I9V6_9FIRM|nr:family 43 glycosylhydrolase [Orenia metallireducens]PRX20678.1 arabinan endo-1,5-alpha-L-arabinosidase [Orenia metallireducens]SNY44759.1 arabinan endo-1,5-alpha-L-arabinosidase [Orenia metallireducens]